VITGSSTRVVVDKFCHLTQFAFISVPSDNSALRAPPPWARHSVFALTRMHCASAAAASVASSNSLPVVYVVRGAACRPAVRSVADVRAPPQVALVALCLLVLVAALVTYNVVHEKRKKRARQEKVRLPRQPLAMARLCNELMTRVVFAARSRSGGARRHRDDVERQRQQPGRRVPASGGAVRCGSCGRRRR
jgi:hypothetical protein